MRSITDAWRPAGEKPASAESEFPPKARLKASRTLPLPALLFGAASALDLTTRNLGQTTLADAVPALLGSMALGVVVWLIAATLRRSADTGAALIACIWVVGCVYYLELVRHLNRFLGGGYEMLRPLPIALAVMVVLSAVAWRWGGRAKLLHTILAGISLVMVATPAWKIAAYEWRHGDAVLAYDADAAAADLPPPASPVVPGGGPPPDIFHFIFDRYGSEAMLARHYGIDRPIGDFLEAKGFYVARDSNSNYLKTGHSLASTFAMDYLTGLAEDPRVEGSNWRPIYKMLDDHKVGRFLRARGYEHHQFGSWWVGTYENSFADTNRPHGFSEFNLNYLRRTIALPLFHLLPRTPFAMRLDWDNAQCQRIASQIDEIKKTGGGDRPVYVFAHILVPHGPYVFAPDGRCMDRPESIARGEEQGYIEQIAYADVMIRDLVMSLRSRDRQPVILIQADEGPFPDRDYSVPWQEAPAEELRIKTGILNAYSFPDGEYGGFRQDISPVNSYRQVFNDVFGTSFEDLPDRIHAFPNDGSIYEFHDVTERVRCEDLAEGATRDPQC